MVGGGAYVLAAAAGPRLPQRREIQTRRRKRRLQCARFGAAMGRRGPKEKKEEACGVWLDAAALKRRKVQVGRRG